MLKQSRSFAINVFGVRRASVGNAHPNWLEKTCGSVPIDPHTHDREVSEMLRGGHAMQVASAQMLDARVANFRMLNEFSASHAEKLKELRDTEKEAVQRINEAVRTKDMRFRPSLAIPAIKLCSSVVGCRKMVGCALRRLGDAVTMSYVTGVKMAVSEYYNDQIREIYASDPDMVELKELFKVARDEEQAFVDANTPDILDSTKNGQDPVATFAKASFKMLTQIAKIV